MEFLCGVRQEIKPLLTDSLLYQFQPLMVIQRIQLLSTVKVVIIVPSYKHLIWRKLFLFLSRTLKNLFFLGHTVSSIVILLFFLFPFLCPFPFFFLHINLSVKSSLLTTTIFCHLGPEPDSPKALLFSYPFPMLRLWLPFTFGKRLHIDNFGIFMF